VVLPFVVIDESKIAPFHAYGVCVALSFFAWDYALMKMAVRRGFDRADFRVFTVFLFVFGWGFAWAVDAVFYRPVDAVAAASPPGLTGLSSTGAILGATVGAILWSRVIHLRKEGTWRLSLRARPHSMLAVSEVVLATWPLAWAIGRFGCALVHDHIGRSVPPGTLGSLVAVGIPRAADDGLHRVYGPVHVFTGGSDVRYDLGLLECALLAAVAIGFALTWKRNVKMGTYTIVACLVYGPFRFGLDFLRASEGVTGEARHGGLTFAQYWSLAVIALGLTLSVRRESAPTTVRSS
jgi:phosphatidylglycerol:prolipoprotein diacylglycerol transferase